MCGIVGLFNFKRTIDLGIISKMNDSISHRGPDDEGYLFLNTFKKQYKSLSGVDTITYYKEKYSSINDEIQGDFNGVFAHRRLSILDLSELGHQPMSNEDESIWLVFNGEIYNYMELRDELISYGHIFRSHTDTEVIIHAYEEWGENCLEKFNGMWAFALYDFNTDKLFCARDRFGVKPFYFYCQDDNFMFSSEIKAILQNNIVNREVNTEIAMDFLDRGVSDHTNQTFFKGIYQLQPSFYLTVVKGELIVKRYYDLKTKGRNLNIEEAKVKFFNIFKDSVKLRLRSDVPFGSALSGGLDSSAIVSMVDYILKENGSGLISNTFSSVFDNKKYDEQEYIDEVNMGKKCIPHKISPNPIELIEDIKSLVNTQEEPFGSLSIYAQWKVMKLVSETDVKVLLDGQGADEILAGYKDSYDYYLTDLLKAFNFKKFRAEYSARKMNNKTTLKKGVRDLVFAMIPENTKAQIYRGGNFKQKKKFHNKLNDGLYYMLYKLNLPAYLHNEDRNSMAYSIESRVPFLDYRLVEFSFSLPPEYKINLGMTKYIIRESLKGVLPEKIRIRKDKMGFVTPQEVWQENELKPFCDNIIRNKIFLGRDYFKCYDFKKMDCYKLWRCISMELWLREFIDQR